MAVAAVVARVQSARGGTMSSTPLPLPMVLLGVAALSVSGACAGAPAAAAAPSGELAGIVARPGTLAPAFAPMVKAYTVQEAAGITSVAILASASDPRSLISIYTGAVPPAPPPSPAPPAPPHPPAHTLSGTWSYTDAGEQRQSRALYRASHLATPRLSHATGFLSCFTGSGEHDSYRIQMTSASAFTASVLVSTRRRALPSALAQPDVLTIAWGFVLAQSGGHSWKTATGTVSGSHVSIRYDSGKEETGTVNTDDTQITWEDRTHWDKTGIPSPPSASPTPTPTNIAGSWHYTDHTGSTDLGDGNVTCRGSLSMKHCVGKGTLEVSVLVNSSGPMTLSVVVEASDNSSRTITPLTLNFTAPTLGCYATLGVLCTGARKQGLFQCASCAGSHAGPIHLAGCNNAQIQGFCNNATCTPALEAVCASAKASGSFQCGACVGTHHGSLDAVCTTAQEAAWCSSPRPPGQCVACGSSATCCTPGLSPPQLCPGGSHCCACGATSCSC